MPVLGQERPWKGLLQGWVAEPEGLESMARYVVLVDDLDAAVVLNAHAVV